MNDQGLGKGVSEQGVPPIVVAVVIGAAMVVLGGYAAAIVMDQVGTMGGITLWALGGIGGILYQRLAMNGRQVAAGWILIVACVLAFVVAEVLWINWNIVDATPLAKALSLFPTFLAEYKTDAFIAAIFTFFGAGAAYKSASP